MRYLVLTDIHSNLEALDVCLRDATARGFDRTLVLGDIVGYGADPNAVIERVLSLSPTAVVRGNHDKVALGMEYADGFNAVARNAAQWTRSTLTREHLDWLKALPEGPVAVDDLIEVCHGTPFDEDEYVFDELDAARAIEAASRPVCLFGHTHHPVWFELRDGTLDSATPHGTITLELKAGSKYLVNPGSVGQPRDGDPRAAYAVVDTTARVMELYRLEYPIAETQRKIVAAGLPESLARRLGVGH